MRLLILTQLVDQSDSTLGFFHRWLIELAKHFSTLTVLCLQRGKFNLPSNIKVLSLGKETGRSKIKYLWRFYKYIWQERNNYDAVFVHMNQEYILLGGLFWKFFAKPIYFWRNHYAGSFLTDLASFWCVKVFCTSRYSYTAKYKKTIIMPVGFDTETLKGLLPTQRKLNSILIIGRISPSKNIHLIVEALGQLLNSKIPFIANIYGNCEPKDEDYHVSLVAKSQALGLKDFLTFHAAVPKTETKFLYTAHEIVINASPSGMLDKTIFSAMGCGCLTLISNYDLKEEIPAALIFKEGDSADLVLKLKTLLKLPAETKERYAETLQDFVLKNHSLSSLAEKLFQAINY